MLKPRKKTKDEKFEIAISKVPKVLESGSELFTNERLELKKIVVNQIWANKICSNCWNKNIGKLKGCALCFLNFYCDKNCQQNHWTKHKLRCKNPLNTTFLDTGPQGIRLI